MTVIDLTVNDTRNTSTDLFGCTDRCGFCHNVEPNQSCTLEIGSILAGDAEPLPSWDPEEYDFYDASTRLPREAHEAMSGYVEDVDAGRILI